MNAVIVTRTTTVDNVDRKPGKLNKQMERICQEDARRQAHQARVIADNAEWCRQMRISPEDAAWMFL